MRKISFFLKNLNIVYYVAAAAIILITLSLFQFKRQVNSYIIADMRSQIDAIQKSSTQLVQNELTYLKHLTVSVVQMINRAEIETDEDILQTLQDYADSSNILRTLFITLDGHVYTSHAGFLGQNVKNLPIDAIDLSQIKSPAFSQPYYDEDLDEIIFGVISPVIIARKKGVLISSYNVNQFYELLENEFIGGSVEIGILNNKGEVVVGKSIDEFKINIFDSLSKVKFLNSSAEEMQINFANGSSGFSSYYVGGIERYCSYAPIAINDWYVIAMVKEDSLRSSLTQLEKHGLQLTAELVVIMLILLFVVTANRRKEQEKMRMVLQQAAMTDGLTEILNRRTTETKINQFLNTADRGTDSALLVIDLDNFKLINDEWGHLLGDAVLRECASRLKDIFSEDDIIGRVGGDEFVVFVKNCLNVKQIQTKINCFISDFYVLTATKEKLEISVSAGIALTGADKNSFTELYQQADIALYRAKNMGKGRLSL